MSLEKSVENASWDETMSKKIDEDSEKIMQRILCRNMKETDNSKIIEKMKRYYESNDNSKKIFIMSATEPKHLTIEEMYETLISTKTSI